MKSKQYRSPQTLSEMKQNTDVEHKEYVRGKRSKHNLPDAYDDLSFSRRKKETMRQKLQSRRNFRESIRFMEPESPYCWVEDYPEFFD